MMTKTEILRWLRANKQFVKIHAIAKAAGVSYLSKVVNQDTDGHGRPSKLADKHVEKLSEIIDNIRK